MVIINNMDFEKARERGKQLDDRYSSTFDECNLTALFERLHFRVISKQDVTAGVRRCVTLKEHAGNWTVLFDTSSLH